MYYVSMRDKKKNIVVEWKIWISLHRGQHGILIFSCLLFVLFKKICSFKSCHFANHWILIEKTKPDIFFEWFQEWDGTEYCFADYKTWHWKFCEIFLTEIYQRSQQTYFFNSYKKHSLKASWHILQVHNFWRRIIHMSKVGNWLSILQWSFLDINKIKSIGDHSYTYLTSTKVFQKMVSKYLNLSLEWAKKWNWII